MCSFAVSGRGSFDATSRTGQIGQAGNAMHVEVCAIIILYALTQIEHQESEQLSPTLNRIARLFAARRGDS
jgi:hypothetical protein